MTHFVSTPTSHTTCPRCDAPLLVAIDEGLAARVDATPINRHQEIAALVAGKWTYTHAGHQLIHRDPARIRSNQPPGTIHAQHLCGSTR